MSLKNAIVVKKSESVWAEEHLIFYHWRLCESFIYNL